ncbi:MAG: adenylate/guanylate cyclase domain-containing protein [Thiohalomonadales bacterium]
MIITSKFQIFGYYLLSVVVLSIFSMRSASDLATTTGLLPILVVAAPFLGISIFRFYLESILVTVEQSIFQAKKQIVFDLSLFIFAAILIVCLQLILLNATLFLLLKTFTWCIIIGYYASIDSATFRTRDTFLHSHHNHKLNGQTVSMAYRLNIFLSSSVLIIAMAIGLSAYSYMSNINAVGSVSTDTRQEFIVEALFILGIIFSLTTRVIFSYSLNVQYLFERQMEILQDVENDKLDHYIPVMTRDEFGIIAQQTNQMIDKLREKEKIQKTLESIVSPNIMEKLLQSPGQNEIVAEEFEIAILFCDLRKFTSYAENTPPEEVIYFLNAYFTKIADIVAEHGGIINKFMGDAILAVYGVEGNADYVEKSVETALDILMHSESIKMRDGTQFDIGIGIHKGKAAAGTIGSADRFEYTFIGDAVNTASRLDGLSKRLNHKIVISDAVYDFLQDDLASQFNDLGRQTLRGRTKSIQVYGAVPRMQTEQDDKVIDIKRQELS